MKQLPVRILGIAPYERMCASMEQVSQAYPNIQLDVFLGDLDEGVAVARAHLDDAYDCIISRGGTAEMIRQITDIPVVEIRLSMYDVLRTIKLAENYTDRYAIVGFPSITAAAHTLCDLLQYELDIITVRDTRETYDTLTRLQQSGCRMVIGDMVTHTMAQELGLSAFLITSGPESLQDAFEQAVSMSAGFRRLRMENAFLSCIMKDEMENIVVLDERGVLQYAHPLEPAEDFLEVLREKSREIPTRTSLKFYHNQRGKLYRVVAQTVQLGPVKYYLFHFSHTLTPIRSDKNGVRTFNKGECDHMFINSFYNISGALGELDHSITAMSGTRQPVVIIGEVGTGKEQIARLLYLRSTAANRPFVVIDCSIINDKNWDFLLNHYNSPLNDNGNTIYFQNYEALSGDQCAELLALVLSTDLTNRQRLLFSCTCRDGERYSTELSDLIHRLGCLPLVLPTLRSRADEIPSLASLYLGSLNLELGKHISGFDAHAIEQLRRFSWPHNYTQFKRVLQELATLTNAFYIRSSTVADVLAQERFSSVSASQNAESPMAGQTLDQIIRSSIMQAIVDNNGNQTAAARQLGVGRTTIWRYLNQEESRK